MKRFLYQANVDGAEGNQTFYIDAETQEEADARAQNDESDGIYESEVEVTSLGSMELIGETTTDDYGDFPPAQHPTSAPDSSLEQDAARYRWLRDDAMALDQFGGFSPYVISGQTQMTLEGDALDAAVDAAIAAKEQK